MFWKYNFGSSAQIETLLQKDDVTLQELMDEDELLQECKAQNRKLIDFLTKAEILEELVSLVVSEPVSDGDIKLRFKYSNLAAEILTSDVPPIIDKLVASTNLLDILYKFLENKKPLNPLLASFFSKVLGMLVQRRSEQNWYSYQFTCFQVLDFLKSKGNFVILCTSHVGTSAIMDLLLKLITNVEEDEIRQSVHEWLNESRLVESLVERLSPNADPEEHASADNLLCEISWNLRDIPSDNSQGSPLLTTLESEDIVNKLLDLLLHEERNESSLSHVINVLVTLLSPKVSQQNNIILQQQMPHQQGLQQSSSIESSDSESGEQSIVARTIAKRLPNLHNILVCPPKKGMLLTAYGHEMEPLGSTRLQVVTLVAALIVANDPIVHNALFELNTIEHLLDLFFKYSLNNFLHTQVEYCLNAILTKAPVASTPPGDTEHRLLTQLFTECRLIERVIGAYEGMNDSLECKQNHDTRGYMGHLRQVANTIVQQAECGPNEHHIKQLIQDLPGDKATQWDDFVSNSLAEVNRKNEITPLPWFNLHNGHSTGGEHEWGCTDLVDIQTERDYQHQPPREEGYYDDDEEEEEKVLQQESDTFTDDDTKQLEDISQKKGFKEMDMDVIGEFRYADEEFKDTDDNLSGPLQRLSTQALAVSGASSGNIQTGVDIDDESSGGDMNLFLSMCSKRLPGMQDMEDIWTEKEKEITFAPGDSTSELSKEKENSSSDEEDDDSGEFRSAETKMDVDDWAEVFDRRSSNDKKDSVNPWQSAPMADTSDNSGWADFGAFSSNSAGVQFGKSDNKGTFVADFDTNFSSVSQENSSNAVDCTLSTSETFKADFTNVNFETAFAEFDEQKNMVGDTPNSFLASRGLLKSSSSDENETANAASGSELGQTKTVPQSPQS